MFPLGIRPGRLQDAVGFVLSGFQLLAAACLDRLLGIGLFLGNLLGSAVQLAGITVLQRLGVLELLLGLGIHILIIAFPFFHKSLDRFEKQKVKTAGQDGEV